MLLPAIGVVLVELLLLVGAVRLVLWLSFGLVVGCVLGTLVTGVDRQALVVLGLLPLFRLVTLGMPTMVTRTILYLPFVYGAFLPAALLVAQRPGAPPLRMRWGFGLVSIPLLVGAGVLLGELEYALLQPESLVAVWTPAEVGVLLVVMVGFVAFTEELLYRGLVQNTLVERLGAGQGILLTAALYGAMHAPTGSLPDVGFAIVAGTILGALYQRTDSLLAVTLLHGALNVYLFGVRPVQGSIFALFGG